MKSIELIQLINHLQEKYPQVDWAHVNMTKYPFQSIDQYKDYMNEVNRNLSEINKSTAFIKTYNPFCPLNFRKEQRNNFIKISHSQSCEDCVMFQFIKVISQNTQYSIWFTNLSCDVRYFMETGNIFNCSKLCPYIKLGEPIIIQLWNFINDSWEFIKLTNDKEMTNQILNKLVKEMYSENNSNLIWSMKCVKHQQI